MNPEQTPSGQISAAMGRLGSLRAARAPLVAFDALADQLQAAQRDHPHDLRLGTMAGYVRARARADATDDEHELRTAARLLDRLSMLTDEKARRYNRDQ